MTKTHEIIVEIDDVDFKRYELGETHESVIRCKDCREHGYRTNMCAIWHHHTNPQGYCHRGRK